MIHNPEDLEKIKELYIQGALTEDEYMSAQVTAAQNGQAAALSFLKAKKDELQEYRQRVDMLTDDLEHERYIKQVEIDSLNEKLEKVRLAAVIGWNLTIALTVILIYHFYF